MADGVLTTITDIDIGRNSDKTGKALNTKVADNQLNSEWVSPRTGDKWIEFSFSKPQSIGHLQFLSGQEDISGLTGSSKISPSSTIRTAPGSTSPPHRPAAVLQDSI